MFKLKTPHIFSGITNILKQHKTTIDDLLTEDDVNDAINIICEKKSKVKSLIIIYANKDNSYGAITTENLTNADMMWYLEQVKLDLLTGESE